MNWQKLTVLVSLNIFLLACSKSGAIKTGDPSNSKSGPAVASATTDKTHEVFGKNCSVCHQASGEGGTVKLEDNTKLKVPSLKSDRAIRHSDKDYTSQILKGGDGMPAFKEKLKEAEINDLIRFIRREFQGNVTAR